MRSKGRVSKDAVNIMIANCKGPSKDFTTFRVQIIGSNCFVGSVSNMPHSIVYELLVLFRCRVRSHQSHATSSGACSTADQNASGVSNNLRVCALMLCLVARHRHKDVLQKLDIRIGPSIRPNPSLSLDMLKHRGAIYSMLNIQQIDEAAQYLCEHASTLAMCEWIRVMTALCTAGQADQAISLYKHWMYVSPSIEKFKNRRNWKRIVPNVATYMLFLSYPATDSPLSAEYLHIVTA